MKTRGWIGFIAQSNHIQPQHGEGSASSHQNSFSIWLYAQLHYFLNFSQLSCFLSAIIGQID